MKLGDLKKEESPVVTTLGRLIARMALDEALHRAYLDDPEAVIAEAGLEPEEEAALRAGDWPRILRRLGPRTRPYPEPDPEPGTDPP